MSTAAPTSKNSVARKKRQHRLSLEFCLPDAQRSQKRGAQSVILDARIEMRPGLCRFEASLEDAVGVFALVFKFEQAS